MDKAPRNDKFNERRAELGEAVLQTLAQLGYARTSLREIAQNSEFSHGVLHYYFTDKVDLILCSVRQYKARCVTRYDDVTIHSTTFQALLEGFAKALGETLRNEAPMHRLWYDLRSQSMFEEAYRAEVAAIDKSLEKMIWRVMTRLSELAGAPVRLSSELTYAMFDGLFQRCLLRHLCGDAKAVGALRSGARALVAHLIDTPQVGAAPAGNRKQAGARAGLAS
jgi:AcrR family transcriptional regulator